VAKFDRKLLGILVKQGVVDESDREDILEEAPETNCSVTEYLLNTGRATEEQIISAVSVELNLPPIDLAKCRVADDVLELIPADIARHYTVFPITKVGKLLTIAIADPMDILIQDDINIVTGCELALVVSTDVAIRNACDRWYGDGEDTSSADSIDDLDEPYPGDWDGKKRDATLRGPRRRRPPLTEDEMAPAKGLAWYLVEDGVIDQAGADGALDYHRRFDVTFKDALTMRHKVKESDYIVTLVRSVGTRTGVTYVDLLEERIDHEAVKELRAGFCAARKVAPLSLNGDVLTVAMSDPLDPKIEQSLRRQTRRSIVYRVSRDQHIAERIRMSYGKTDVSPIWLCKDDGLNLTDELYGTKVVEREPKREDVPREPGAETRKRYALVVGIDYADDVHRQQGFGRLAYAQSDALQIAERLSSPPYGFEVLPLVGRDATLDAILDVFKNNQLRADVPPMREEDQFLIFFAGCGEAVRAEGETSYVLHPYNGAPGMTDGSISMELLGRLLQGARYTTVRAGQCMCVLDACRPVGARGDRTEGCELDRESARDMEAVVGSGLEHRTVQVLFGCDFGQRSWEDATLRHGVLAHHLLEALRDPPEGMTFLHLVRRLTTLMEGWEHPERPGTRQKPRLFWDNTEREIALL